MQTTSQTTFEGPAAHVAWQRSDALLPDGTRVAAFELPAKLADAPTVLLLHGLGHWTQAAWDPLAARLLGRYRLVAFDLPGFGMSDKPERDYPLEFFTQAVRAVVEAKGLKQFTLAGHSLGGFVAADYARSYADDVEALVLIDPAGFVAAPGWLVGAMGSEPMLAAIRAVRPSRAMVRRILDTAFYDPSRRDPAVYERSWELAGDPAFRRAFGRVYADTFASLADLPPLHARFGAYRGPVRVFWGREDPYIPLRGLGAVMRVYPQAEATIVERCGHCPNIEYPDLVAETGFASRR